MKMLADKQRHKTKEIKEKACISNVQLDELIDISKIGGMLHSLNNGNFKIALLF